MNDVYKRLAKKFDENPKGFPATKSGIELKILKKIFKPEEAEMALKIRSTPETVEAIAERLDKPIFEMKTILIDMAKKGQIVCFKMSGQQMYMFYPFFIGMCGFQFDFMDKELAELFEEYTPMLMKGVGRHEPAITRVIPVNARISGDHQVHRYEDVRQMIMDAKSFRLQECFCRKQRAVAGHPCNHTKEVCLNFSSEENAWDTFKIRGRIISKDEALKVLSDAEEEGLVHTSYNVQGDQKYVCNCCICSCPVLRGMKEFKAPYLLAKSNFVATIDQEGCDACGVCKDERCPMDAIIEEDGVYAVQDQRCIGCGVCTVTCPSESITLVNRPKSEITIPSANLQEWDAKRAETRGIELK